MKILQIYLGLLLLSYALMGLIALIVRGWEIVIMKLPIHEEIDKKIYPLGVIITIASLYSGLKLMGWL